MSITFEKFVFFFLILGYVWCCGRFYKYNLKMMGLRKIFLDKKKKLDEKIYLVKIGV